MKYIASLIGTGVMLAALSVTAWADDTEIYLTSYARAGQPNILFVLDSSGSMNKALELGADGVAKTRYEVMKEVLDEVLASVPDTVNVGLLNYGGHKEKAQANGIRYPVTSLSPTDKQGDPVDRDVRQEILEQIDRFKPEGYTPLVQSLYEAALYFRGEPVDYGAEGTVARLANPDSYTGGTREKLAGDGAAATKQCNKTANQCPAGVELSCLAPSLQFYCQVGADQNCLRGVSPRAGCELRTEPEQTYTEIGCADGGYDEAGNCISPTERQVTVAAHESWYCPAVLCTYEEPGDARFRIRDAVYKSPITEACQANYLVLMSDGEPDDGLSLAAGDPAEHDPAIVEKLGDRFDLGGCEGNGDGQCGPELTRYLANVDQMRNLEGSQTIGTYTIAFAVEEQGQAYLRKLANLGEAAEKDGEVGYFTASNRDQLREVFNKIVTNIAVVNHDLAIPTISVDPETGLTHGDEVFFPFFRPGISPRWPGNLKKYRLKREDGVPVVVDSLDRPIYDENGNPRQETRSFWLPDDDPADGGDIAAGGAARLLEGERNIFTTDDADTLVRLNADNVDAELFGDDAVDVDEMIDYAYGKDTTITAAEVKYRHEMGDVLHSSPVIVPYENAPDLIFVATNEGFLHAIDTETGKERFAFIPRELLPVLKIRKDNAFDEPHPYGLDGYITVWTEEKRKDGDARRTFLVAGMRRGGTSYYALDITDPDAPTLAWSIHGGDDGTAGFEDLGQTWSRAVPATVSVDGEEKAAFIFSGGYDPAFDQPDPQHRFAPKIRGGEGNTVFAVDATTGKKIWQLDLPDAASIPANPRVIDIDNNGVADRIYVVDIEGRLYRIDLPDPDSKVLTQKVTAPRVVQLADLGSNGEGVVNRRFYNEPDAALIVENGVKFVTISLGSGYRAHPLLKGDAIDEDYLFVVRDPDVHQLPPDEDDKAYHVIRLADLKLIEPGNTDQPEADARGENVGWALRLNRKGGEKALARAVTLKNVVYFTTFQPETKPAVDVCSNASHTGRVYGLNVKTGKPALRFVDIDEPKLSVEFETSDIPSEVVLVASRYEEARPGGRTIPGVKFDFLGSELKGLKSPAFSGLNKQYWEVRPAAAAGQQP